MNKKKKIIHFFDEVQNLMKYKYSLFDAISIIENSDIGILKKFNFIKELKTKLQEGNDFYSSICFCGYEKEIENYKTFLTSQEKDICLQKNLEYIVATEKEKASFSRNLLSVCIYPICIIFFSCVLTLYLINNKEQFYSFVVLEKNVEIDFELGIMKAFSFLVLYCSCFFLLIYKLLKTDFSKNLMFNLHFLFKQKYTIKDALQLLIISEKNRKHIFVLQKIQNQLNEGKDFFQTVKELRILSKKQLCFIEKSQWIKELQDIFEDYFLMEKNRQKERIECIQKNSESILITGIGIYLLILIKNTILIFLTF